MCSGHSNLMTAPKQRSYESLKSVWTNPSNFEQRSTIEAKRHESTFTISVSSSLVKKKSIFANKTK